MKCVSVCFDPLFQNDIYIDLHKIIHYIHTNKKWWGFVSLK